MEDAAKSKRSVNARKRRRSKGLMRAIRSRLWSEAGGVCPACGELTGIYCTLRLLGWRRRRSFYLVSPGGERVGMATLDHVVPLAKGGSHAPENLRFLCCKCNDLKSESLVDSRESEGGE